MIAVRDNRDMENLTQTEQRYMDQMKIANGDQSKLWTRNGGLWTKGELTKVRKSLVNKGVIRA